MRILLVCATGMSTTLIINKITAAFREDEVGSEVIATTVDDFADKIKNADVVLLGPQVKYKEAECERIAKEYNIPLGVINSVDYGMIRGEKILEQARKLLNK